MVDETAAGSGGPTYAVAAVAAWLGGRRVFGRRIVTEADLADAVERRLPLAALDALESKGVSEREIETLILPRRTLSHRRRRNQRLTVEESDRAVRLARVLNFAEATFGDADKAGRWLRKELAVLDGRTPLSLVATAAGARVVEDLLARIAWGAAA